MAYQPIQSPKWSERDALPQGDQRKIIKAADFDTEFNNIKTEFDRINRHGVVASVKYNGANIMYNQNVVKVSNGWNGDDGLASGQYKVWFDSEIAEFDEHYAPVVTAFPAIVNGLPTYPVIIALQEFYADAVVFTVHQIGGDENGGPSENAVGFALLIVDMASD
jgi:hypothetical protein